MLFNTPAFLAFFLIVTTLYFAVPHRARWALLLAASSVFYMYFIPEYIVVLVFTIVVDYAAGIWVETSEGRRRRWLLAASVLVNVGVLAIFKYFNFLADSAAAIAVRLGATLTPPHLAWALPIGLSFHTFQSMSYTFEVYRGRQRAERHLGIFALYVLFYPQLVAGPIERPQNLLHQFREEHRFDRRRAISGLKLMGWGLVMKSVIADRLAVFVDRVYAEPSAYGGPAITTATALFALQIFCDFAGYSTIALGAARVMGFELMENFRTPYLATGMREFWSRWHISLSTWFRDYLYIPLGGNRVPPLRRHVNLFLVFLVSGLWHGANWTFVVWGAAHGAYIVGGELAAGVRARIVRVVRLDVAPRLRAAVGRVTVFTLASAAWVFFRADSIERAGEVFRGMTHGWRSFAALGPWGVWDRLEPTERGEVVRVAIALAILAVYHMLEARGGAAKALDARPRAQRWAVYHGLAFSVLLLGVFDHATFIYFQF